MSEVEDDDVPILITLIGDFFQLIGDLLSFLIKKTSNNGKETERLATGFSSVTILGNLFQALGSFIDGVFQGEFKITYILPISGNIMQAIGGVLEILEETLHSISTPII